MLPPVRAPSSVSPDYQSQVPQIAIRPRLDLASAHSHAAANDMPLSGGRLDILSLSGQLQIAQGSSIFAETIGALLDMPRGENEPLTDYAKRLTEAVKAMSPGERAVLERMLNQLVKGVSVRLLAEFLNNPAGLEAAKLAMSIEGAQLAGTDQATSAVVSSYRQNGGDAAASRTAAASSANPAAPAGGQSTAPAQAQAAATPMTTPASPASTAMSPAAQQPQAAGQSSVNGAEPLPTGLADAIEADVETISEGGTQRSGADRSPPLAGRPMQGVQAGEASGSRSTASTSGGLATGAAFAPMAKAGGDGLAAAVQTSVSGRMMQAASTQMPGASAEATKAHGQAISGTPRPDNGGGMTGSIKHPEAARHAAPENAARPSRSANEPMPAALAEWLAEAFAADLSDASTLSSLLARAPETSLDEVLRRLFGRSTPSAQAETAQTAAPEHTGPNGAAAQAETASAETTAAEEGRSPNTANPKMANADAADAPDARFVPTLPVPVMREALVPNFVPYPPAEEEEERRERKAQEVDAIGEDRQEDAPEDQSFHHHGEEEEGAEGDDTEEGQGKVPDEESARANDLYWRMAGWN
ncbi:hypothetical protein [Neorhizobium alkalisoli]|uniref:Uncharacterized protein n=1 Tax=Neorhizobium alkalisoli TaxID=528178 RepID=A0A561QR46_9HYPH|nr:hypothetical protein [Neorhizobium alkalisoli]TWF52824.1 hypothetical protein FHW37_10491 [Neorhizobium alkalisoli]